MEHRQDVKPTFQFFARWIKDRAKISRLNKDTSAPQQKTVPKTTSSTATTTSSLQTAQTQRMRNPMLRVQRSTPGGDKEYRDTVRRRPSTTGTPNRRKNSPSNFSNQTRPSKSRENSPKPNKLWCAWCTENGRAQNHSTVNCAMFKDANV